MIDIRYQNLTSTDVRIWLITRQIVTSQVDPRTDDLRTQSLLTKLVSSAANFWFVEV